MKIRTLTLRAPQLNLPAPVFCWQCCLSSLACNQSQPPTQAPPPVESRTGSTEKVFVEFRGPWAFVVDPKERQQCSGHRTPEAKGHRDLDRAGFEPVERYWMREFMNSSLPTHSGSAAAATARTPALRRPRLTVKACNARSIKSPQAYVIRLPRPEEYLVARRHRSRLGAAVSARRFDRKGLRHRRPRYATTSAA
jgi:hypothetical protein